MSGGSDYRAVEGTPKNWASGITISGRLSGPNDGGPHGAQTTFPRVHRGGLAPQAERRHARRAARKAGVHVNTILVWKKKYGHSAPPKSAK